MITVWLEIGDEGNAHKVKDPHVHHLNIQRFYDCSSKRSVKEADRLFILLQPKEGG